MTEKRIGTRLHRLTVCALFAALLCVLSPIAIPLGPIPLSLGLCGVLLTALTLSPTMSLTAVAAYLALGACGLPVFGGALGGASVLVSPTGGYLWSYLILAPTVALLAPRATTAPGLMLAGAVALPVCYACGTLQFALVTETPLLDALTVTVLPFLPFDLLKLVAAAWIAKRLRTLLGKP